MSPIADSVWRRTGDRIRAEFKAGRDHLMTEDTIRRFVSLELQESGVEPRLLEYERPISGPTGAMIDLVVGSPVHTAIELKYPRSPRSGNRPYTDTMGALLADLFRLDGLQIRSRYAIWLLQSDLAAHLARRAEFSWAVGRSFRLTSDVIAQLPATAQRHLREYRGSGVVAVSSVSSIMICDAYFQVYQIGSAPGGSVRDPI